MPKNKRKTELINKIFRQTGGSCQSAAIKPVFELEYYWKHKKKLDLDYYKFYKRMKAVYGVGDRAFEKADNALNLLVDEGMYCKRTKKYYKIKKWKKVFWIKRLSILNRNPFSLIMKGKPLILACLWRAKSLSEASKKGDFYNRDRLSYHAMAGICGDKYEIDVIWVANSHGIKAVGTDKGWFRFERRDHNKHYPLIEAAYSITI